jgi:glycosyltransferase involved in cell wall biosynthesis
VEDESRIVARYSNDTRKFLSERRPLLAANASQIVFASGEDLYGLDLCVDLVLALRSEFPGIGLLFALANPTSHPEYLAAIRERIAAANAGQHFHFLTGQQELWPVFKYATLMLRPTTGDGYAVSVAEALALGCAVLASDAVERPSGVHLFRSRDLQDLIAQARTILSKQPAGVRQ